MAIYAAKDYKLDDEVTLKGKKLSAQELSDVSFRQDEWPSFKQSMWRVEPWKLKVRPVVKQLRREIHTGVLRPDGWVEPYRLALQGEAEVILNRPGVLPLEL